LNKLINSVVSDVKYVLNQYVEDPFSIDTTMCVMQCSLHI